AVIRRQRPIFAVAVDDRRAVSRENPGIAMQIEVADEVVIVSGLLEPDLRETIGAREMAVVLAVKQIRISADERHAQSDLITALAGGVPAIKRKCRRVVGRILRPARADVAFQLRLRFRESRRAVSAPGVRGGEEK